MKTFLSCAALLCVGLIATAEEPRTNAAGPANKSIDGTWTVLSAEKDGQPMTGEAKDITVTVKDNVVMVRGKDGKEMKLKMEFTSPGLARVTDQSTSAGANTDPAKPDANTDKTQGPKQAVYVLTNDYLSICVHDAAGADGRTTTGAATATGKDTAGQPSSKSFCSFVLKRTGGTGTGTTGERRDK